MDGPGPDAWLDGEQARAAAAAGGPPPPSVRAGARVQEPGAVSPWRAVAGAAVAVAGVALGIGAVLTLTDEPDEGLGPALAVPVLTATTTSTVGPTTTTPAAAAVAPTSARPVVPGATPSPAPTRTPRPTRAAAPAPEPAALPALTVLNNSRITGLADRAARRFAAGGWPVREVGNFTGKVRTSTVYHLPGQEAVARRLADQFDVPRVLPRFAGLPGSGLTVVLTRDFA